MRAWILIVLCGCYEPAGYARCELRCTEDCPDDLECNADGFCVPPGDTAKCENAKACPTVYKSIGAPASQYRFVDTVATMVSAAKECAADDDKEPLDGHFTHLLVLSDDAEYTALLATVPGFEFTIGHTDTLSEGTYKSVTYEDPPYFGSMGPPWAGNEPIVEFDCAVLTSTRGIVSRDCATLRRYICECDRFEDQPTRYMAQLH